MSTRLELWQEAVDERPTYARASGAILRFTEPERRSRPRKKKSWQEAAALRRMALDEREVRMRKSDRKLRELGCSEVPARLCYCGRRTPCALHPRAPRHKTRRIPPPRGSAWRRIREVVLHRDGHRCRRCGSADAPGDRLHVHHVVARSEGGTDSLDNLVTLCALCHPQVERSAPADLGGCGRAAGRYGGDVDGTEAETRLVEELVERFPALRSAFDERRSPRLFFWDVAHYANGPYAGGDKATLQDLLDFLEQAWAKGPEDVEILIHVSFIENLMPWDSEKADMRRLLGPHLDESWEVYLE